MKRAEHTPLCPCVCPTPGVWSWSLQPFWGLQRQGRCSPTGSEGLRAARLVAGQSENAEAGTEVALG